MKELLLGNNNLPTFSSQFRKHKILEAECFIIQGKVTGYSKIFDGYDNFIVKVLLCCLKIYR